jgi:HTH-type transcriptional regulator/antitoxin HigA
MSNKTGKFPVADSYLKLICEFPLRPIRNDAEYDAAFAVMEKLAVRGEDDLNNGERDYLDPLDEFIAAYDRKHFAILTTFETA